MLLIPESSLQSSPSKLSLRVPYKTFKCSSRRRKVHLVNQQTKELKWTGFTVEIIKSVKLVVMVTIITMCSVHQVPIVHLKSTYRVNSGTMRRLEQEWWRRHWGDRRPDFSEHVVKSNKRRVLSCELWRLKYYFVATIKESVKVNIVSHVSGEILKRVRQILVVRSLHAGIMNMNAVAIWGFSWFFGTVLFLRKTDCKTHL